MNTREFAYGIDARQKIFAGIKLLNDTTSVTLGPAGRNAAMHLGKQVVLVSKDGITVAEQVQSPNKWEQMGVQIAREASDNCNQSSGDGTTSAVVMTYNMAKQALHLPEDCNVIKVKRGMQKAVDACTEEIKKIAVPCKTKEDFKKVALISSQDEEIAEKVTDVFMQSGEHGAIDIEYSEMSGMEIEHTDGFVMEKGWIMNHGGTIVMEDVPVLVTDKDIKNMSQILPVMELLAKQGMKKLFIVCDNLSGEALGMLVNNINAQKFQACAVKVPSFGKYRIDIMRDVCAATGATFVSTEENILLEKISLSHLGRARRVTVDRDRTVIVAGDSVEIRKRMSDKVTELENLLKTELDDIAQKEVKKRLATLTDGVSIIKFGAQTEIERHERKHRIEDAVRAVQSAREEGVTIGGGSSYLRCLEALNGLEVEGKDEQLGVEIVKKALRCITMRVLEVAGVEDRELIVSKIIEKGGNAGYNFKTGEIADMVKIGVIEPAKVIRCVLQNAVSCSKEFLSLEVAMSDSDPTPLENLAAALKQ
jgi:chaperonin GroEL